MLTPLITADASCTARSDRYGETYHSRHGAVGEARHVFLAASRLSERLEQRRELRLLEIGFGLGLNCLLSADLAEGLGRRLDYDAAEHELIDGDTLRRMDYARFLDRPTLAARLARALDGRAAARARSRDRGDPESASARVPVAVTLGRVTRLRLHPGDATRRVWPTRHYDIVYLDAFSEPVNPECWTPQFLKQLHGVLRPGGVLTTYSVRGRVRRALASAGFATAKAPGPPGKRDMLLAHRHPL